MFKLNLLTASMMALMTTLPPALAESTEMAQKTSLSQVEHTVAGKQAVANQATKTQVRQADAAQSASLQQAKGSDGQIERIAVTGQQLRAQSETNQQTAELLAVAGSMNDPLAAVFSLPGVVYAGGDYGGQPAVRGSAPQDNAFLIDGLPAGYLFHLFGNSVLNEKLLHDFSLQSAAFDASIGNSTAGVFAATLREPRFTPLTTTIDASMLQLGVLTEGQISDSQAFYVGARQSTLQYFIGKGDELDDGITVYQPPKSHDYQARYMFAPDDDQRLTLTLTGAADSARANISKTSEQGRTDPESVGDATVDTAFNSAQLAYQLQLNPNLNWQSQLQHLRQKEDNQYGGNQFIKYTDQQTTLRSTIDWQLLESQQLTLGGELGRRQADYRIDAIPYYCTDHQQDCFEQRGERLRLDDRFELRQQSVFVQHQWQFAPRWRLSSGLRYDQLRQLESAKTVAVNTSSKPERHESYLQPRLGLTFSQNEALEWFVRGGRYSRVADIEKTLPQLGNPALKQPLATHYVVGNRWQLATDWQLSTELYLKKLSQLPLALTAQDADEAKHYSNDTEGEAKGVELLLKKQARASAWSGWLSLSYAKANRTDLRQGKTSDYVLDTPLVANLVVSYPYNEQWDLSARLTVRSGASYTPIIGTKVNPYYPDYLVAKYGELNSARLPIYHRLDLQAEQQSQLFGWPVTYTYAILNVLNRRNVSGYYLLNRAQGSQAEQRYTIEPEENLGLMPSIGLKMQF